MSTDRTESEQDAEYRRRLLREYDTLIHLYKEALPRAGATFGMWVTPSSGKLILAALKTARDMAEHGDDRGQEDKP